MVKFQLVTQSLWLKSQEVKASVVGKLLSPHLVLIKHGNKFEDALFPVTQMTRLLVE